MIKCIIFSIAAIGVIHKLFYGLRFSQFLFQMLYFFSI